MFIAGIFAGLAIAAVAGSFGLWWGLHNYSKDWDKMIEDFGTEKEK